MQHTFKRVSAVLLVLLLSFTVAAPSMAKDNGNGNGKNKAKTETSANSWLSNLFQNDHQDDRTTSTTDYALRYVLVHGEVTAISGATLPAQITVKVTESSPNLVDEGTSLTVHVDSKSHFIRNLFGTSALAELNVGDKVQVFGQLRADGTLGGTSIKDLSIKNENRHGTVDSVNLTNQTFVLVGKDNARVTVQTNAQTKITAKDGAKLALADLTAGTKVHVKGVLNSRTNVLTAQSVSAELAKPTPLPMSFRGTLQALSTTSLPAKLTLKVTSVEPPLESGRTIAQLPNDVVVVTVDANTVVRAKTGEAIKLSQLRVGDQLSVQASVTGSGSLNATIIQDESLSLSQSVSGTISALNAGTQTLSLKTQTGTTTVAVLSNTTISLDGQTGKVYADLTVSASLVVKGYFNSQTNVFYATSIEAISAPTPLPMSFRGELTALGSTALPAMLTIRVTAIEPPLVQRRALTADTANDMVTVQVDANTKVRTHTGEVATLSQLTLGDDVSVQATMQSNGSLTATIVEDHSLQQMTATSRGTVSTLNQADHTFMLLSGTSTTSTVQVTADTQISLNGVTGKTWTDIVAGHFASVLGFINSRLNLIVAQTIELL